MKIHKSKNFNKPQQKSHHKQIDQSRDKEQMLKVAQKIKKEELHAISRGAKTD